MTTVPQSYVEVKVEDSTPRFPPAWSDWLNWARILARPVGYGDDDYTVGVRFAQRGDQTAAKGCAVPKPRTGRDLPFCGCGQAARL